MRINPYTPGAGVMPGYLAGREELITQAEYNIDSLIAGYPQRPIIYYGLRGVGKTVLLNKIEEYAESKSALYFHMEAKEKQSILIDIITAANKFLIKMSTKEKVKSLFDKAKELVNGFTIMYTSGEDSISVGFTKQLNDKILADNLTELLVNLGNLAKEDEQVIIFFIDEIQYAKQEHLEALITAQHRINQKRLPVTMFGAGLNKILVSLTKSKTYAERMFEFNEITSINYEETRKAILKPAIPLNIGYEEKALEKIFEITEGYPYFIQEFCKVIWDNVEDTDTITLKNVEDNIELFYRILDEGFFRTRFNKCTDKEKEFIYAMVECGGLPCTVANVAQILGVKLNSISPARSNLIHKGIIYSTKFGEIDFTVPQFHLFLKRVKRETD